MCLRFKFGIHFFLGILHFSNTHANVILRKYVRITHLYIRN
jgi:hypothetical protein